MTPLDLRTAPPRPPREELLGVATLPRAIDKLRAALPGGELGDYYLSGITAMLLEHFDCDEARALAAVREAPDETAAARAIVGAAAGDSIAAWNATVTTLEPFRRHPDRALQLFGFASGRPDPRYAVDLIAEDDARTMPGVRPAAVQRA